MQGLRLTANADGAFALRREGRAYGQALTVYLNTSMAWLGFVDREIHQLK